MHNQKCYHHNVYYVPPEIFFGEQRGRDEIDRWLDNVEKNNAAIESLYDSEKRFRDMIDFLPVPVGEYDFEFKAIYANQAAFDFFGYTPEDMAAGVSLLDLVPDTEKQQIKERMRCLVRGENPGNLEMPLRKKDGSLACGQIFPSPVIHDGKPVGVRTCFLDLTERREKERERQQLEEQLRHVQKMEAIGTLAGGIAHDFNNILSSIIGFAQLAIEAVEAGSELHEDLNEIYRAGIRARNLVKQILSISRPQKHENENRPFYVGPLFKEALKMLRATIPATIQFQTHLKDSSLVIDGNPDQLHQVIVNLVTNAALAMSDHGGTLEVILEPIAPGNDQKALAPELLPGNHACLTVRDTGVGIPAEHLAKIFEPYFTTREKREGTGLGLSIVHSIVKSYKGPISVASEPGEGTSFHVYLPLAASQVAVSDRLPDNANPPRGTGHLLFADDEVSIVKMQRMVLESLGYTVTAVTSSLEALRLFKARPYA
ncbi:MAG TPA: ATP-binding protein, partial [Tichowtungia sp.]|nr:ATP-binding protein [Tichowtungia sp.]